MVVVTAAYVDHGSIGTKPDAARVVIGALSTNSNHILNLHVPAVSTLTPERATSEAPGRDFAGRNGLVISRPAKITL